MNTTAYHRAIKMKPINVKDNTHIDFGKQVNDKDRKFKVVDHVRISKHRNIFAKGYTPNWLEKVFVIKEIKNKVPWTYVINDLNGKEIIGTFYEKELQRNRSTRSYASNRKDMIIHLTVGLIKKT